LKKYNVFLILLISTMGISCNTLRPLYTNNMQSLSWMKGYWTQPDELQYENWIQMPDSSIEHISFIYDHGEPVISSKRKIYKSRDGIQLVTTLYHENHAEVTSFYLTNIENNFCRFENQNPDLLEAIEFKLIDSVQAEVTYIFLKPRHEIKYLLKKKV